MNWMLVSNTAAFQLNVFDSYYQDYFEHLKNLHSVTPDLFKVGFGHPLKIHSITPIHVKVRWQALFSRVHINLCNKIMSKSCAVFAY